MSHNLKQLVIDEFSGAGAQALYTKRATAGLWLSETHFITKYFTTPGAAVLDLGCGTGRTTIPLVQQGFKVIGVDVVAAMIDSAKKISLAQGLTIDYRVGDATKLDFPDGSFQYILFSNQGWSQIPSRAQRQTALAEMTRVLAPGGIAIFTAHPRVWRGKFLWFWVWQWVRFYILKPLGWPVAEVDFGDRFFDREVGDSQQTYRSQQFIHIATKREVTRQMQAAGLTVLEANGSLQISAADVRAYPPVFYVGKKILKYA